MIKNTVIRKNTDILFQYFYGLRIFFFGRKFTGCKIRRSIAIISVGRSITNCQYKQVKITVTKFAYLRVYYPDEVQIFSGLPPMGGRDSFFCTS